MLEFRAGILEDSAAMGRGWLGKESRGKSGQPWGCSPQTPAQGRLRSPLEVIPAQPSVDGFWGGGLEWDWRFSGLGWLVGLPLRGPDGWG
jgi:hypothetical protein